MTDEELIRCFEAAEAPPGGFPHREHVRVAWWYLRRLSTLDALERFRANLRRFAAAQGATDKYHETMTTAYMLVIAERLDEVGRALSWSEFADRCPDILSTRPSVLDSYYRPETLASARARAEFVMPDREDRPLRQSASTWLEQGCRREMSPSGDGTVDPGAARSCRG